MAATGIRGVRLAKEIEGDIHVTINDQDEEAYKLIKRNIKFNRVRNASASKMDLNLLLSLDKYDMIDIDPFGSPAIFIDSAIRSIKHDGIISCTATDTATLCGVYPRVCLRRYSAYPYHSPIMQEVGLRILIGFIAREAAKHDKGIEPLICYSTDYYFRLYIQVKKGRLYADETISKISTIRSKDLSCFTYKKGGYDTIGPLYIGALAKKGIIKEIREILFRKKLNTERELCRLLDLLEDES
ncbi:MAG: tRNA (guanine(10)-N(2))-dimethyltransferase, partial [Candidatus Thermoplasmatota archaeon]